MQIIDYKGWRLLSAIQENEAKELFDLINDKKYKIKRWLKQHHRSDVMVVDIPEGDEIILKIPKEKNNNPWIRFTTLYRTGEAFKNMNSLALLNTLQIPTNTAIMAAENRIAGMVTDSWLLYHYIEGKSCLNRKQTFNDVIHVLKLLHTKGYRHGDPQIRNFIQRDDNDLLGPEVFVIDSNPSRPLFPAFAFAKEYAYLSRSQPGIEAYFSIRDKLLYKIARFIDVKGRRVAHYRRKLKSIFIMK